MGVKGHRLSVGDMFLVPLDESIVAYGQVVGEYQKGLYFFAFYGRTYPAHSVTSIRVAVKDDIVLLGLSMDAKIHAGDWTVVGQAEVDENKFPLPAYKEAVAPGVFDVVDYSGTRRRSATASEEHLMPFRAIVAPIRLERALKAVHGLEPWLDAYDTLRVPPEATHSRTLFGLR